MVSSIVDKLKCFNDSNFKFDPKYHRYTYGGKQYTSVTTFLKNFHKPFEEDYWSKTKADEAGIAYAISKDVSIGYSAARTKKDGTAANEKMQQISLGYSLGPISTGITVGSIKNLGGTADVNGDAILARAAVNF